ncbi:PaaI family thioesterase [Oceanibaculum pacificum]|uniref:Medium/long-chain acyl-CoA thioesterase YigI n=1 Tax=Oceanibaculum pacificum TaxID=580166 RepID=A0A154VA46_9PROT|nr:PaaI family thioesterase [Oceanibaculum pacificum]KZC98243.1 phenylacetic acid degradation protein PaaI [Oceanibaculum pacificum]
MSLTIRDPDYETRVRRAFDGQRYMHFIGASLISVTPGGCEIRLPYRPELSQHDGFFHGGVIGAIADNACGFASYTVAAADQSILTVEYKLNIISPGIGAALVARGRIVKPGRRLVIAQADVHALREGREKLVATSLSTLMLLDPGERGERA